MLPAGNYRLLAYPRTVRGDSIMLADSASFAEVPLSLTDTDITGLTIVLRPGPDVSGRMQFEGELPKSRVSVSLQSLDGDWRVTENSGSEASDSFTVRSVRPGRYQFYARTSERMMSSRPVSTDWRVRSAGLEATTSSVRRSRSVQPTSRTWM